MAQYVAKKFVASSPRAEIIGSVLMGFLNNLRAEEIRPLLAEYGLDTIDSKKWYPQQLILDFYRALAEEKVNATDSMVALGVKAIENIPVNPNVRTLDQAIQALESISQSIQRNGPAEEGFHVADS